MLGECELGAGVDQGIKQIKRAYCEVYPCIII